MGQQGARRRGRGAQKPRRCGLRKFIVLPLLVLLAACTDMGPIGPDGDGGELVAAKGGVKGSNPGKGGGGGGDGGGGGEPLPTDVAAIVFVKQSGLFVMNADGANQTKVYGTGVATPSWSPDGDKIVFHERTDQGEWIRTIDITMGDDGGVSAGGATYLFQCIPYFGTFRANCHPAWSPDGNTIAVADGMSRPASIRIVHLNGGAVDAVYTAPKGISESTGNEAYNAVRWPTWSPSGDSIAFAEGGVVEDSGCPGGVCVRVIAFDGTRWNLAKTCPLRNTAVGTFAFAESLEWARTADANPNTIVFSGLVYGESKGGIYMLDIEHCAVSLPIVIGGRGPVWSPDDEWIAWVKTGNDQLMLYSNETGNSYKVASGVRDPDWLRIQRTTN